MDRASDAPRRRPRVGPLDVAAVVLVLVVLLLPDRDVEVESAYARLAPDARADLTAQLAAAQGALGRDPADGRAAQDLVELLLVREVAQHDEALRIAGQAAERVGSPTRWRALQALSWAHAERFELEPALATAELALSSCDEHRPACPVHERARLEVWRDELHAGVEAVRGGADPRADPAGFRRDLSRTHPISTFRSVRSR
jgi:hypothetical protein